MLLRRRRGEEIGNVKVWGEESGDLYVYRGRFGGPIDSILWAI